MGGWGVVGLPMDRYVPPVNFWRTPVLLEDLYYRKTVSKGSGSKTIPGGDLVQKGVPENGEGMKNDP